MNRFIERSQIVVDREGAKKITGRTQDILARSRISCTQYLFALKFKQKRINLFQRFHLSTYYLMDRLTQSIEDDNSICHIHFIPSTQECRVKLHYSHTFISLFLYFFLLRQTNDDAQNTPRNRLLFSGGGMTLVSVRPEDEQAFEMSLDSLAIVSSPPQSSLWIWLFSTTGIEDCGQRIQPRRSFSLCRFPLAWSFRFGSEITCVAKLTAAKLLRTGECAVPGS